MTTTEQFMAALQTAENTGDVSPLVALHAGGVTLRNMTERTFEGEDGAREFWQMYLNNFDDIHSEFYNHHEAAGLGVMEWVGTGHLKGGHEIAYRGTSIIDIGQDGKVTVFRTYYDSAAFVAPAAVEQ